MATTQAVAVLSLPRVVAALGNITRVWSASLLVPAATALAYEVPDQPLGPITVPRNALLFLAWAAIVFGLGSLVVWATRRVANDDLQDREAYMTVGLGWIVLAVLAMVPFLASGVIRSPVDAFFESMSGLTTTGATIFSTPLEDVPASVNMWRAVLEFLGGMGIVVLGVAVLARLTHGGMQMLQAESPGPTVARLRPRLAQTAKTLWGVYLLLSAVLFAILFAMLSWRGMTFGEAFYDAVFHTLTTVSTGGFSNHSASIAYYESAAFELVIVLFMLLAGTNFSLHYHWLRGDWRPLLRDPEWRFYMLSVVTLTVAITGVLWQTGSPVGDAFRGAAFTATALLTGTGFATVDYDAWPDLLRTMLLIAMLTGGTAGSTSGGMKHIRILLLIRLVRHQITRLVHPNAVVPLRIGGQVIKPQTAYTVVAFFFSFVAIWIVSALVLAAVDPILGVVDAAAASLSALSNVGPAFGVVGPTEHHAHLLPVSKLILAVEMWIGRLEVFTALLLLSPDTWRH